MGDDSLSRVKFKSQEGRNKYNELISGHPAYSVDNLKIELDYENLKFKPVENYSRDKEVLDLVGKANSIIEEYGLYIDEGKEGRGKG